MNKVLLTATLLLLAGCGQNSDNSTTETSAMGRQPFGTIQSYCDQVAVFAADIEGSFAASPEIRTGEDGRRYQQAVLRNLDDLFEEAPADVQIDIRELRNAYAELAVDVPPDQQPEGARLDGAFLKVLGYTDSNCDTTLPEF